MNFVDVMIEQLNVHIPELEVVYAFDVFDPQSMPTEPEPDLENEAESETVFETEDGTPAEPTLSSPGYGEREMWRLFKHFMRRRRSRPTWKTLLAEWHNWKQHFLRWHAHHKSVFLCVCVFD